MCRFKSGLILKDRVVVAQGSDDSHSILLEQLNIKDSTMNAMTKFVRAELIPPNGEWWTDPEGWKFHIDQDIRPDWFNEDAGKYEERFRDAVKEWWKVHVLVDQKIDELREGYYRLKRCEVKKLLNDVKAMLDNSTVQKMLGNSTVQEMLGNSTVQEMWDNSTVQEMWDNSTVQKMWGNSTVQEMWDNSTVQKMCGNSIARSNKDRKVYIADGCGFEVVRKKNAE